MVGGVLLGCGGVFGDVPPVPPPPAGLVPLPAGWLVGNGSVEPGSPPAGAELLTPDGF